MLRINHSFLTATFGPMCGPGPAVVDVQLYANAQFYALPPNRAM